MDVGTITLLAGIVSCIVGVSTFIVGRMAKAEHNGSLEEKINQALEGIASINQKLEKSSDAVHEMSLLVQSHDEKIKTLFKQDEDLKAAIEKCDCTKEILIDLINTLKDKE